MAATASQRTTVLAGGRPGEPISQAQPLPAAKTSAPGVSGTGG
jgi:hypothetical protein